MVDNYLNYLGGHIENEQITLEDLPRLKTIPDNCNIHYVGLHGSRMLGTNRPDSDYDIVGVYSEPFRVMAFKKVKAQGNHIKEINGITYDEKYNNLRYFIHSLMTQELDAINIMFSEEKDILFRSELFQYIMSKRHLLISKDIVGLEKYITGMCKYFDNNKYYQVNFDCVAAMKTYKNNLFHTYRYIFVYKDLINFGDLKDLHRFNDFLISIKQGDFDYCNEQARKLPEYYKRLQYDIYKSKLPNKFESQDVFLDIFENYYKGCSYVND